MSDCARAGHWSGSLDSSRSFSPSTCHEYRPRPEQALLSLNSSTAPLTARTPTTESPPRPIWYLRSRSVRVTTSEPRRPRHVPRSSGGIGWPPVVATVGDEVWVVDAFGGDAETGADFGAPADPVPFGLADGAPDEEAGEGLPTLRSTDTTGWPPAQAATMTAPRTNNAAGFMPSASAQPARCRHTSQAVRFAGWADCQQPICGVCSPFCPWPESARNSNRFPDPRWSRCVTCSAPTKPSTSSCSEPTG